MDEIEEIKIKAEIDAIAKNIDTIMERVANEDPGRPPALEPDAETGR